MKIGEIAKLANTTIRTVRYYEEEGLLFPSGRTKGGFRFYNEDDLKKLKTIKMLKSMNMGVCEIGDLLNARRKYKIGGKAALIIHTKLHLKLNQVTETINKLNEVKRELEVSRQLIAECTECEKEIDVLQCNNCNFTDIRRGLSYLYAAFYI
ncbi:MAG: MerR family transcriptional regulator [Candidatus Schekmanbacteria bacterium]|nr:MerR family transcriptional regulator [Candidatus Schekmanbacteria bacterium]